MSDGVHAIDTLRWMCGGEVVTIQSLTRRVVYKDINHILAMLHFDNGATGVMMASWNSGRRVFKVQMHAPSICAEADLEDKGYVYADNDTEGIEYDIRKLAGSDAWHEIMGYPDENRKFIDCLRSGKQPDTNFADAVKTMEAAERILAATWKDNP